MNITLPEPLETRLTPAPAALHLATGHFTAEEVTLGQAAEAAGLSRPWIREAISWRSNNQ